MLRLKPTSIDIQRAIYRTTSRANLETQLVQSVLDYLGVLGFKAYRRNVGASERLNAEGRRRLVKYGEPGQADVWAIGPDGLHIEVEVKVPGKTPRANQEAWLEDCEKAGAIALCVSSLSELSEKLRDEFQKRRLIWKRNWTLD
jgi:hypothetical protein